MPRNLCLLIGNDPTLLQTRKWVLEMRFRVQPCRRLPEVNEYLRRERFDLVVLCSSLSVEQCRETASLVRRIAPKTKILRLNPGRRNGDFAFADAELLSGEGPRVLLERATEMVAQTSIAGQQSKS